MHPNPTSWHRTTAARALIGVIAASGIEPTNRPRRDNLSSDYAPIYHDNLVFDCPEFERLAGLQQQALTDALNAAHEADRNKLPSAEHYDAFTALARQNLGELVAGEIAALSQQVAA